MAGLVEPWCGLSPWLADSHLLAVSSHGPSSASLVSPEDLTSCVGSGASPCDLI